MDIAAIVLRNAQSRDAIVNAVERLLEVLDWIDADADLEDDPDLEPSLGWTASFIPPTSYNCVDLEDEHDGREEDLGL